MTPDPDWFDRLPRDRLLAEVSLWSADLGRLAHDIARVDPHADLYHIDVADGHFSPTLLFFPDLVAAIRAQTATPLHVHLMATDDILATQIDDVAAAAADLISIHAENGDVDGTLALIERRGLAAGLVLQLHTPVAAAAPYLGRIRLLTLLGTRIGIKGQALDPAAEPRLRAARALLAEQAGGRRVLLGADGGIRAHTVPELRRAGADTIVMGSLAFGAADLGARMAWVHAQPLEPD